MPNTGKVGQFQHRKCVKILVFHIPPSHGRILLHATGSSYIIIVAVVVARVRVSVKLAGKLRSLTPLPSCCPTRRFRRIVRTMIYSLRGKSHSKLVSMWRHVYVVPVENRGRREVGLYCFRRPRRRWQRCVCVTKLPARKRAHNVRCHRGKRIPEKRALCREGVEIGPRFRLFETRVDDELLRSFNVRRDPRVHTFLFAWRQLQAFRRILTTLLYIVLKRKSYLKTTQKKHLKTVRKSTLHWAFIYFIKTFKLYDTIKFFFFFFFVREHSATRAIIDSTITFI